MTPLLRRCLAALSVLVAAGCATQHQTVRSELQLKSAPSTKVDGLTISAKVLDFDAVQRDRRLTTGAFAGTAPFVSPAPGAWRMLMLLRPPVYELTVTNGTGHVLRLAGMVVKLVDGAGQRHGLMSREQAGRELAYAIQGARAQNQGITPEQADVAAVRFSALKLLGDDVQLLPGQTETLFAVFALPFPRTEEGLHEWLAQQTALTLALYDVPTRTDAAGTVTKRTTLEFPVAVKSFRETYEISLTGSKLLARVAIEK